MPACRISSFNCRTIWHAPAVVKLRGFQIIVHLILIILIVNFERLEKWFPWMHSVVAVARPLSTDKNVTFDLPKDLQKAPHKSANVLSDKDRIAMSRHPELDPKELRKILSPPPGRPGMNAPASPQQARLRR